MTEGYDLVVVSPHLDDAVLSCGGLIAERAAAGQRILIVTVAAADEPPPPFSDLAVMLHRAWRLTPPGIVAARRAEDAAACRALGAELLHLDVPEAIYVRHPDGEPLYDALDALFAEPHPEDPRPTAVSDALSALPPSDLTLVPLAIGDHVDHRLTRSAAESLERPLAYYEDFPYAEDAEALEAAVGDVAWRHEVVRLSSESLDAKRRAVAAYTSQIKPLFKGPRRMNRRLTRFVSSRGGERIWRRGP